MAEPELEEAISDLTHHVSGLKKESEHLPKAARDAIQNAIDTKEQELGIFRLRVIEAEASLITTRAASAKAVQDAETVLDTRRLNVGKAEADLKDLKAALVMEWRQ